MKRFVTIICLLLASVCASAGVLPDALGLHLYTAHAQKGLDNSNPGVYARWDNRLTVGTLRNSLDRQSGYVGYTLADRSDTFELTAGVISGYNRTVVPLLVPSVRVGITDHLGARLSLLKAPGDSAAVHLSLEWRL